MPVSVMVPAVDLGSGIPLIAVPSALDAVFEEGADEINRHLCLPQDIIRVLFRRLWGRLFVVQGRLSWLVTVSPTILIAPIVSGSRSLLVW